MNLIFSESQKIFRNTYICSVFAVLFLLNFVVTFYLYQDNQNGKYAFSASGYRKLQGEISEMSTDSAYSYIKEKLEKFTEQTTDKTLQYEDSYYLEYLLLSTVLEEVDACRTYAAHVDEVIQHAQQLGGVGILERSSEYAIRSNQQVVLDFETMRGRTVTYGASKGITLFLDNKVTDFLALVCILIALVELVTKERDSGELLLYKTTVRGRKRLGFAKLLVLIVTMLFVVLILYAVNLILAWQMYGLGDLNRAVQSIPAFLESVFPITVKEFLILFFAMKILSYLCITMLFYFLAIRSKRATGLYFTLVVCFAISFLCYFGIGANSRFNLLKYMNFYGFLQTDQFVQYRNLDIASVPCSSFYVYLIVVGVLTFAFGYLAIGVFMAQKEAERRIPRRAVSFGLGIGSRSTSLFVQECYKLLWNGKGLLMLALFAVFMLVTFRPVTESFYVTQDAYYDVYIDKLSGPVTTVKMKYIEKESERYEGVEQAYQNGTLSQQAYANKMKAYASFCTVRDEKLPYLMSVGGYFIRETGYKLLTGAKESGTKDVRMAFLAVAMLIFPFSYLYGMEYQNGTNVFLHTYYNGTVVTAEKKVLLGVMVLTIVYVLVYVPFYASVFATYGWDGLSAPACSMNHLYRIPAAIDIGTYLFLVALARYLGLLLVMLFLFGVSRITKSVIGNCVVGIVFVILPLIFAYLDVPNAQYVLLNPLLLGNVFAIPV